MPTTDWLSGLLPLGPNTSLVWVAEDERRSNPLSVANETLVWSVTLTPTDFVLIFGLSLIIVAIFVGNIFVVLSVIVFCKMRTLSNGLIASLASADLLVAVLVLPISLQYEVLGRWTLGPYVCDLWITSDVFCCTASILNIVVIAIDRYWLITRNVRYTHGSVFPRRKVCLTMLAVAWMVSALISCSPLFGWRKGTEKQNPDVCLISQDYGYTVFSTFSSFWLPLFVILAVYCKIFLFARRRVIRRSKPTVTVTGAASTRSDLVSSAGAPSRGRGGLRLLKHYRSHQRGKSADDSLSPAESTVFPIRSKCLEVTKTSPDSLHVPDGLSETVSSSHCTCGNYEAPPDVVGHSPPTSGTVENYGELVFSGSYAGPDLEDTYGPSTPEDTPPGGNCGSPGIYGTSGTILTNRAPVTVPHNRRVPVISGDYSEFRAAAAVAVACVTRKRKSHSRRIRRSARTLGLIIGGFLVCWLPFFLVATIAPFCSPDEVPRVVQSLVLWLGYSNSLLNPAIYAIWEKTFRRSFRRLSTCDIG